MRGASGTECQSKSAVVSGAIASCDMARGDMVTGECHTNECHSGKPQPAQVGRASACQLASLLIPKMVSKKKPVPRIVSSKHSKQ